MKLVYFRHKSVNNAARTGGLYPKIFQVLTDEETTLMSGSGAESRRRGCPVERCNFAWQRGCPCGKEPSWPSTPPLSPLCTAMEPPGRRLQTMMAAGEVARHRKERTPRTSSMHNVCLSHIRGREKKKRVGSGWGWSKLEVVMGCTTVAVV